MSSGAGQSAMGVGGEERRRVESSEAGYEGTMAVTSQQSEGGSASAGGEDGGGDAHPGVGGDGKESSGECGDGDAHQGGSGDDDTPQGGGGNDDAPPGECGDGDAPQGGGGDGDASPGKDDNNYTPPGEDGDGAAPSGEGGIGNVSRGEGGESNVPPGKGVDGNAPLGGGLSEPTMTSTVPGSAANGEVVDTAAEVDTAQGGPRATRTPTGEELIKTGLVKEALVAAFQKQGLDRVATLRVAAAEEQQIRASRQAKARGSIVAGGARKKIVDRENEFALSGLGDSSSSEDEPVVTRVVQGDDENADDENTEEDRRRMRASIAAMHARRRADEAEEARRRADEVEEESKDSDPPYGEEAGLVRSESRPPPRALAVYAVEAFKRADWRGCTRTRQTRAHRVGSALPEWTNEVLDRLVDRKTVNGIVFYRVEWAEYEGADRHTWEPVENLTGQIG